MHQLTIEAETRTITSRHDDFGAARQALLAHARQTDTYLRAIAHPRAERACFELISLDDTHGRPSVTGAAFIEPMASPPARTVTPYYAAAAALLWTSDQHPAPCSPTSTDCCADDTHPALAAARAAVQSTLMVSPLWYEATALADLTHVPMPPTRVLDSLQHTVVTRGFRPATAAALAASVQRHLDSTVTPEQTVAATWWTALLTWSVTST